MLDAARRRIFTESFFFHWREMASFLAITTTCQTRSLTGVSWNLENFLMIRRKAL
jgi:hypothetical protein